MKLLIMYFLRPPVTSQSHKTGKVAALYICNLCVFRQQILNEWKNPLNLIGS
jgi:hypothetical protein